VSGSAFAKSADLPLLVAQGKSPVRNLAGVNTYRYCVITVTFPQPGSVDSWNAIVVPRRRVLASL
jgi:hypothetical protein